MKHGWPVGVIAIGAASTGTAQTGFYPAAAQAVKTLVERNIINPQGDNPIQPQGFENPGSEFPTLPDGTPDNRNFRLEKAGSGRRVGNKVHIEGGTEFWFRGYHVFADTADGDLQTNIFTLDGNVILIGKDATVIGKRVVVNFGDGVYLANNSESQISPTLVKGQIQGDLYSKAEESHGSQYDIWTHNGSITSCDLPDPHFELESQDAEIRPGKRLILRKAKVIVLGHTLLNVPYLSIPLDDKTYRYTPQVGQSQDEGYFIKTRYPFPLRGGNTFDSRIDYMTKLGAGLGGDYRYFNRTMNGILQLYTVNGPSHSLNFSNDHRQDFKWGTLTLNNDYQQNNYLTAPGSTLLNTRAQLALPGKGGASTRFSLNRSNSTSSGFQTTNNNIAVSDSRSIGAARTTVDVSWLDNSSKYTGSDSERQEVDVHLRATEDLKKATANFEYLRSIPVGETQGVFGTADKTPFLSLTSDTSRIFGRKAGDFLPTTGELSFGEFGTTNGTTADTVGRYNLDLRFSKPDRSDHRLRLDASGQFRQGLYSDDTAQYTHALNLNASYRLGQNTAANIRYNYTRQYGYTPLLIDSLGKTNLVSADVSYRPWRPLLVAAQTSYDILRLDTSDIAWQQVGIRTEYQPSKNFLFRTNSYYDTFQQSWSNVRLDFGYKQGELFAALGASYDALHKTWSNANFYMDNLKWGRLKLSAVLSYNGFTKQFDSQQFAFIYDLHCAEAILIYTQTNTGFRAGNDFQLFIRLKVLPFDLPFGFGTRGQPLGSPQGTGF